MKRARVSGIRRTQQAKRPKLHGQFEYKQPKHILPELKSFDIAVSKVTVPTAGEITGTSLVMGITQGTTASTRLGRRITVKKIQMSLSVEHTGATVGTGCELVRAILFQDKQSNGAVATVAGILSSADWKAFRNLDNIRRFRILSDKTYTVIDGGVGGPDVEADKVYVDCNIPIDYDASSGAITDLASSNIGVLLIAKQGDADYVSTCRIKYVDN